MNYIAFIEQHFQFVTFPIILPVIICDMTQKEGSGPVERYFVSAQKTCYHIVSNVKTAEVFLIVHTGSAQSLRGNHANLAKNKKTCRPLPSVVLWLHRCAYIQTPWLVPAQLPTSTQTSQRWACLGRSGGNCNTISIVLPSAKTVTSM